MTLLTADAPPDDSIDPIDDWLSIARDAYETSTDFFDSSVRKKVEKNIAHFGNRHANGSKYGSDAYKYRAKGFRPKTRSVVRKNEAAAATAFFATQDSVSIRPELDNDVDQQLSAEIMHEIVNYRLETTIPWFPTLIGAYQDTLVSGVSIAYVSWDYRERTVSTPLIDPVTGTAVLDADGIPMFDDIVEIMTDEPRIDIRPIENVRFSAAADWLDPINSSPYLIDKIAMFVGDVKAKMTGTNPWIYLTDGELALGVADDTDSVRRQRDGKREDATAQQHGTSDFDTVWVHRNIIRKDDEDWLYYTLGTHYLLSDPVPLTSEYRHLKRGTRPYVCGYSILEPHKVYPASLVELVAPLQQEANDIANQRRDNVALVLNRRYYARRTATIDYKSLINNVPGSITLMDDINQDIRVEAPPDVTGSSYREQDLINTDFDELAGSFSQSSIASNRKLGETVGGMNMLQGDSNAMIEYQLRLFAETWVEPVLRQLVQLEQAYETDANVLAIAGVKGGIVQRYGIDEVTDAMLQGSMTVRVNVGFGSTNPEMRINKMRMGLDAIGTFAPMLIQQIDHKELVKEIMGSLGYRDGSRFFALGDDQPSPETMQMQQQMQEMQAVIQQLQQQLQGKQMETQAKMQIAQLNSQTQLQRANIEAQWQMREEAVRNEGQVAAAQIKAQIEMAKLQAQREIDNLDRQIKLQRNDIERGKLITQRDAIKANMRIASAKIMSGETKGDLTPGDYGMMPGGAG